MKHPSPSPSEWKKIQEGNPLIFDSYKNNEIDIPNLWLLWDSEIYSYILIRRIHTHDKKNSFSINHVLLDNLLLEDFPTEVSEILEAAIEKIQDGKCCALQPNKTFADIKCHIHNH